MGWRPWWGWRPLSARSSATAVGLVVAGVLALAALTPLGAPVPRGVPAAAAILHEAPPLFERGPGGVGLTEDAWRQQRRDGLYPGVVDGRVASVSRPCGKTGCSLQAARAEAVATLLPEDARLSRTHTLPNGTVVDVFTSASSARLWPVEHWQRRSGEAAGPIEPGTLSVAYTLAGGYVLGFRAETGEP